MYSNFWRYGALKANQNTFVESCVYRARQNGEQTVASVAAQIIWSGARPSGGISTQSLELAVQKIRQLCCSTTETLPVGSESRWRTPGNRDVPSGIKR